MCVWRMPEPACVGWEGEAGECVRANVYVVLCVGVFVCCCVYGRVCVRVGVHLSGGMRKNMCE